jgi:pyruvate,water dikinase
VLGRRRRQLDHTAESSTARLARKFRALQELLATNATALELITELENDLLLVPVGDPRVRDRVQLLLDRTDELVGALDRLADGRYGELRTVLSSIRDEATTQLAGAQRLEQAPIAFPFADLGSEHAPLVGNKATQLAFLRSNGFPVPDGFVLSTCSYYQFARTADLHERLRTELPRIDINDLDGLACASQRLREHVLSSPLPPQIELAIRGELRRLMCRSDETFAVRSSAVGEDGTLTFAGQFDSRIHVVQEALGSACREVWASRFNARAIAYRVSSGVAEADCPMAVLFLRMVNARSSGVLYTRDPSDARADALLVTASWGVGFTGASTGDRFLVSRGRQHDLLARHPRYKGVRTALLVGGGVREEAVPPEFADTPSVSDEELQALATLALRLERLCGTPQDIEWAIDETGAIWVLQTRPLRLGCDRARILRAPKVPPLHTGGVTIYAGRASGPVHMAESARTLERVPDGAIVVLRHTCPECVKFLPRIGGLVVDFGNPAGHSAALVREYRVPALFEAGEAMRVLAGVESASLDAAARRVYPGLLFAAEASARVRGRAAKPLHSLAERVTSLKLLDPNAWSFRASSCRSVHDIVRFAHEKAIQTVFTLGDAEADGRHSVTRILECDVPIDLHVLDLGGGIAPGAQKGARVRPEEIRSVPFRALWRGITHPEVSWAGREYVTLSGFASVVARAITDRVNETRELGARSYVAIGENYVNFNSRLAYHYAMVDSCVYDAQSSNFINFRFKGGGTEAFRKNLRARFLQECLQHFGFCVDVREDLVNAWLRRYPREVTEDRLDMLGRLMACSRQLDMFMADEASMRWYVGAFLSGNYRFRVGEDALPRVAAGERDGIRRND